MHVLRVKSTQASREEDRSQATARRASRRRQHDELHNMLMSHDLNKLYREFERFRTYRFQVLCDTILWIENSFANSRIHCYISNVV